MFVIWVCRINGWLATGRYPTI